MALLLVSGAVSKLMERYIPASWLEKFGIQRTRMAVRISTYIVIALLVKQLYKLHKIRKNNQKRKRKQASREFSIRKMKQKCQHLKTEDIEEITSLGLAELQAAIKSGKLKPSQILTAYQAKSLEAHHRTNCIQEYIREAEEWAQDADDSDGEGKLLHGIPISIKSDVSIKGYDTEFGLVEQCELPSDEDCVVLQVLRKHGAIPFCRTNVPQFELAYESSNSIFGVTCNPHDLKRASGGSSGGESSLIASSGSILGIGSDIGGSIRNPCHFTGLCGFNATAARISKRGVDVFAGKTITITQRHVQSAHGPLARDVDSVITTMKVLLDGTTINLYDPIIPPVPFNEQVLNDTRPLRIGYYYDNGSLTTVPAVRRAVTMAQDELQKKGHTLIEWSPPADVDDITDILFASVFAEGPKGNNEVLKYDEEHECVNYILQGRNIPQWLIPAAAYLVDKTDPRGARFMKAKYVRNISNYLELMAKIKHYRRTVTDSWRRLKLDAVICPPFAFPAPPLKCADLSLFSGSYMIMYNVLCFPAGVVRMTRVTEADDQEMDEYPTKDIYHKRVIQAMKGAVGLPVGVQVVTPFFHDELCLRVMKEVESAADFSFIKM